MRKLFSEKPQKSGYGLMNTSWASRRDEMPNSCLRGGRHKNSRMLHVSEIPKITAVPKWNPSPLYKNYDHSISHDTDIYKLYSEEILLFQENLRV